MKQACHKYFIFKKNFIPCASVDVYWVRVGGCARGGGGGRKEFNMSSFLDVVRSTTTFAFTLMTGFHVFFNIVTVLVYHGILVLLLEQFFADVCFCLTS